MADGKFNGKTLTRRSVPKTARGMSSRVCELTLILDRLNGGAARQKITKSATDRERDDNIVADKLMERLNALRSKFAAKTGV